MAETLQDQADLEELFIDSIIVNAHQHAAGAQKMLMIGRYKAG